MSKTIKVKATWEFEFDAEGYDTKFVDVPGLAIDSAKSELIYLLNKREIQASDFKYTVADGTKYGEIIQLPPEEMARWICCPDMLDDNFIHPEDCDNENCTLCCLKYLLSRADNKNATSESCDCEKQPVEVADERENCEAASSEIMPDNTPTYTPPEEIIMLGAESKMEQWAKKCSICKRSSICKLKNIIHEYIYNHYLKAASVNANDISLDIECGLFSPDKKFFYNRNIFLIEKFLPCYKCSFRDNCTAYDQGIEANRFAMGIAKLSPDIFVKVHCKNFKRGRGSKNEKTKD